MGCLFVVLAALSPRLALALVWLFTNLVDRAFNGALVPVLGFVFLPLTTLFYVLAYNPVGGEPARDGSSSRSGCSSISVRTEWLFDSGRGDESGWPRVVASIGRRTETRAEGSKGMAEQQVRSGVCRGVRR